MANFERIRALSSQYLERATRSLMGSRHGFRVEWIEHWHPVLDEALDVLPEMDSCPHDLFRLMVQTTGPVPKSAALVTKHGEPVALAGLRKRWRLSWEPVTQWIIPSAVFPAKPGYLIPALEALGFEVWVAWWRLMLEFTKEKLGKTYRSDRRSESAVLILNCWHALQ